MTFENSFFVFNPACRKGNVFRVRGVFADSPQRNVQHVRLSTTLVVFLLLFAALPWDIYVEGEKGAK